MFILRFRELNLSIKRTYANAVYDKAYNLFFVLFIVIGCNTTSDDSSTVTSTTNDQVKISGNTPDYEKYVTTNFSEIMSLTNDENFDDLELFGKSVSNHRIVQLGESTHGSKQMSQIKTRLIKYLHQYHDFNVIAFESSAFACNMELELQTNIDAESLTKSCVYQVWHTEEVKELFAYILKSQKTDKPLRLTDFDIKFSARHIETKKKLIAFFNQIVKHFELTNAVGVEAFAELIVSYNKARFGCFNGNKVDCRFLKNSYSDATHTVERFRDSFIGDEPLLQLARIIANSYIFLIKQAYTNSLQDRDQGMAVTLTELAEHYFTDEKVIVWAHNAHIAESLYSVDTTWLSMGHYLKESWQDELYTVGLFMTKGVSANNKRKKIRVKNHAVDSLEALAASVNKEIIFLPFSQSNENGSADDWLYMPTLNKNWGYWSQKTILAEAYDAVIVIENSTMPEYLH